MRTRLNFLGQNEGNRNWEKSQRKIKNIFDELLAFLSIRLIKENPKVWVQN
jgi:hypothetical protein